MNNLRDIKNGYNTASVIWNVEISFSGPMVSRMQMNQIHYITYMKYTSFLEKQNHVYSRSYQPVVVDRL